MSDTAIRPYRVDIPQAALDDLAGRLRRTQWPDELPGTTGSYGMTSARVRDLAAYWLDGFDWRGGGGRRGPAPPLVPPHPREGGHTLPLRSSSPTSTGRASTSCTSGPHGRTPRRCCSPTAGPARSSNTWT